MKKNFLTIIVKFTCWFFALHIISSCNSPSQFKYKTTSLATFKLSTPAHMDETNDLVRSAELQLEDHNNNYFIIADIQPYISGTDDSTSLKTILSGTLHNLQLNEESIGKPSSFKTNSGQLAYHLSLSTFQGDDKVFYHISTIKGENEILVLYQWCLENDKVDLLPVMETIETSVTEN